MLYRATKRKKDKNKKSARDIHMYVRQMLRLNKKILDYTVRKTKRKIKAKKRQNFIIK